jgi:hypothetical protein
VLGDTIGRSTTLGSSPVVGGFSLSTQAGSRSVLRHLSFAADQGRRAHAVDGGRVRRRPLVSSVRLPPGQFTLNDLPLETGSETLA